MFCTSNLAALAVLLAVAAPVAAFDIQGDYVESRTCDVYTGPCFANGEVGLAGKQAIMAWKIERGSVQGVDLAGLNVVVALVAQNTLAAGGGMAIEPGPTQSVVLVDARADARQQQALLQFVRQRAGDSAQRITRVAAVPIELEIDHVAMVASLSAGREARLETRKLAASDNCCTNEEIFYDPLAEIENVAPAFTIDGGFSGRGLGQAWSSARLPTERLAAHPDR
jgi:hypothetical protein